MAEVQVNWTEIPGSKIRVTSMVHMAMELAMIKAGYSSEQGVDRRAESAGTPSRAGGHGEAEACRLCCGQWLCGCVVQEDCFGVWHQPCASQATDWDTLPNRCCSSSSAMQPTAAAHSLRAGGVWKVRGPEEVGKHS